MSRISLILHKAEAKPRPSVNIKDILRTQVGFNCLLSHKIIILLMSPMACKWFNRLVLMYIELGYMLDIPQQNTLKYGFSGIEIYIYIYVRVKSLPPVLYGK